MKNKKLFMLALVIMMGASCKKNSQGNAEATIVGRWKWVSTEFAGTKLTSQASGVQKTLSFMPGGIMEITHNDSLAANDVLRVFKPVVLLPELKTETKNYQVISQDAACVNIAFPFIKVIGLYEYQYGISNDILTLALDPCLGPSETIYVRIP